MAQTDNLQKDTKEAVKKDDPARRELDRLAALFITGDAGEVINDRLPSPTRQLVCGFIDRRYEVQLFRDRLQASGTSKDDTTRIYRYLGDEIVLQLKEEAGNRRASMQRNIALAQMEARQQAKKDESTRKRRTSPKKPEEDEAADAVTVEKRSLQEIGREMIERDEADAEERAKRETEEQELKNEQQRFDAAYQLAFQLYADSISLQAGPGDDFQNLIKHVVRLGSSALADRQMAIDQLNQQKVIAPALPALLSGVKDHVIAQKAIMALGRIADPRLIGVLLNLCKEYNSGKEANMRGTAVQSLGNIVQELDKVKKGEGSGRLLLYLKRESFEKDLTVLAGIIARDVATAQMRKYYYDARCLKFLQLLGKKLMIDKQKDVNVPLMKLKVHTPISKAIRDALKIIEGQMAT